MALMAIRPVVADDHPALAALLARAFDDDPVTAWIYASDRTRPFWARRFFRWQLRRLGPQGACWTDDQRTGAALWATAGHWREQPREALALVRATGPGMLRRLPRVVGGLAAVEQAHPRDLHLYLAVLGVERDRRRAGLGSRLLVPGLERADRECLPAYLETAREENLAFYERHGFSVERVIALDRGPTVWTMVRPATRAS
jgi:ribosomal protein S18 acetylase RimI-like enzyme